MRMASVWTATPCKHRLPTAQAFAKGQIAFRRPRYPNPSKGWLPVSRITPQRSVSLPDETWELIRVYAKQRRQTPGQFIQFTVDAYFNMLGGSGANFKRIAELTEYNQLALDRIMRRDFPDLIDPLLNAVRERLATHHGK